MGYRDEGEAALQRVQNLESRVSEKDAENRDLAARLAQANAEIVRLHGKPVGSPDEVFAIPLANQRVFRVLLALAVLALPPLFAAIAKSETLGVQTSLFVIPLWGAALGAWMGRRKRTVRCVVTALACATTTFFTLVVFFATIWRSL